MATYEIDVALPGNTAQSLLDGGYSLYAFKAVKGPKGGSPLVWFKTNDFLRNMSVKWSEVYGAYIANDQKLGPRVVVSAMQDFSPVDLGNIVTIKNAGGDGEVTKGGQALAITIRNESSTKFVTGISQENSQGGVTAMCAFPFHGHGSDVISPVERVLLMFASEQVETGTVIERAFSTGLLFDMTTKAGEAVSVTFDIDKGWDCHKQAVCSDVGFNEELLPLLILPQA